MNETEATLNATLEKRHPKLAGDELTLHLIASGLTLLSQNIEKNIPLALPYPDPLQRGFNRLVVNCQPSTHRGQE